MKTQKRKFDKQRGAALILVVVVTVLLAVVGVMFLMVSRLGEMESVAVADQRDLNAAVQTTVGRINAVLVEDLFGDDNFIINADSTNKKPDESSDYPGHNPDLDPVSGFPFTAGADSMNWTDDDEPIPGNLDDFWLASVEPVFNDNGTLADTTDDFYEWPHITDLWGALQVNGDSLFTQTYQNPTIQWIDPDNIHDRTTWDQAVEWADWQVSANRVRAVVIAPQDRMDVVAVIGAAVPASWESAANDTDVRPFGARADADGDGVADSRWVKVPTLTTSRGKDVFVAVRIIDNCAMLNLNAAHCFYQGTYADNISFFNKPWYADNQVTTPVYHNNLAGSGRYLTEINYLPFLRGRDLNGQFFFGSGGDFWYNLTITRGLYNNGANLPYSPKDCYDILMNIENPGNSYHFFDISDELEIRNRYLLTSQTEARFERPDVANFSLDSGSTDYAALKVPRDNNNPITIWYERIDPVNFDKWDTTGTLAVGNIPYKYDRRHVCTFYSFDRNLRKGEYPLVGSEIAAYLATNPPLPPGFSSMREYETYLWQVFTPQGAVTTDIRVPFDVVAGIPTYYNSTQTRTRILHLLYALREYYYQQTGGNLNAAALSAAQVVANLIDFSDDDAVIPTPPDRQGPFFDVVYGTQTNVDCTFITEQIVEDMISEVSAAILGSGNGFTLPFGLNVSDVVFGYERQPFISEVAADWNGAPLPGNPYLEAFGVELINPYSSMIDIKDWAVKIGAGSASVLKTFNTSLGDVQWQIPGSTAPNTLGYAVLHRTQQALGGINYAPGGVLITDPVTDFDSIYTLWSGGQSLEIQLLRPAPTWVSTNLGIDYIIVDRISNQDVRSVLGTDGVHSLQRDDAGWEFIYNKYAPEKTISVTPYILGTDNTENVANVDSFQLAVANDQNPLCRWHELETLSLYGNGPENSTDPNAVLTTKLAVSNTSPLHFDLAGTTDNPLDYLCTMNRPEMGSLPGRININTAPVHVIAAAIPPTLADPANPPTFSALQLAQAIVDNRPYTKLSDLLNIWADLNSNGTQDADEKVFQRYYTNGLSSTENVGQQSIEDDIEERDWILSNLANKFTVRSDTFTAYILVRLGEDGPQRRMIAIFDRSQVWKPTDRPQLVALHPVPDPR